MNSDERNQTDYRSRIYECYATKFQDASETFDNDAAWRWGRAYRHYLRNWLPENKNAAVLDVACGGGKLLYFFKRLGYSNITGVDISPEQVLLARQVTLHVTEANVSDFLEAHHEGYDLITGFDIVEHLHKQEGIRFLDACYSGLKLGGRLVLHTPNADSPWGMSTRYGDFTHEVCYNQSSLSRLLCLTGFSEIVARELGPVPLGHSLTSTVRFVIWQVIRLGLKLWNLSEIGCVGSGVFTRVFLVSGIKK